MTKKALRDIIADILKKTNNAITAQFLDDIKELGYKMAYRGGLSFNLDDVIIRKEKPKWWTRAMQALKKFRTTTTWVSSPTTKGTTVSLIFGHT